MSGGDFILSKAGSVHEILEKFPALLRPDCVSMIIFLLSKLSLMCVGNSRNGAYSETPEGFDIQRFSTKVGEVGSSNS